MNEISLWPDLEHAWLATGEASSGEAAGVSWTVLQNKGRTRVLHLAAPGQPAQVLKCYAVPGHLAWRTVGVTSRANREFTLMMEAHRLGLPVARPRAWLEQRRFGGLRFSALLLDAIDGGDLEHTLGEGDQESDQRRQLAQAAGAVLGSLHRGGVYWATAAPRNLLLNPGSDEFSLRAIDFPYATLSTQSIVGSHEASLDLSTLLRRRNGDMAFTPEERERLVQAYCEGDVEAAQRINDGIVLRKHNAWRVQRLKRRLRNLVSSGSKSRGRAGGYDASTGRYERSDNTAVVLRG